MDNFIPYADTIKKSTQFGSCSCISSILINGDWRFKSGTIVEQPRQSNEFCCASIQFNEYNGVCAVVASIKSC